MGTALTHQQEQIANILLDRIRQPELSQLMEHVDTNMLANIILTAPRWAQTSLAAPGRIRQRAAEELARAILKQITEPDTRPNPDQLGLSL